MGGLFEKAKKAAEGLKGKAGGLARDHGDKIDQGIDRLAQEADKRTGGKHKGRILDARERAKDAVDALARDDEDEARKRGDQQA